MLMGLCALARSHEAGSNIATAMTCGFRGSAFNLPVWSIGSEALAYIFLAIFYAMGLYKTHRPSWMLVGLGLVLLSFPTSSIHSNGLWRNLPLPYAFFVGNIFYRYRKRLEKNGWIGVCLCAAGTLLSCLGTPYTLNNISVLLMTPGILLIGNAYRPKVIKFPDLSYGIYIWHCLWLSTIPEESYLALFFHYLFFFVLVFYREALTYIKKLAAIIRHAVVEIIHYHLG
jgi:peptidoglycan/LPS O-acetylase OafA/YrhL